MVPTAHLVLIKTISTQAFLFGTYRLSEQIGASEIIRRIGTEFVLDAVAAEVGRPSLFHDDPGQLTGSLLDPERNPRFGTHAGLDVEVVAATAGRALLLVDGKNRGERIVTAVTERALLEAPGSLVHGVVGAGFPFGSDSAVHRAIQQLEIDIEAVRLALPSPEARFPTLPVIEPCGSSGLPASHDFRDGALPGLCSEPARARREARGRAATRIGAVQRQNGVHRPMAVDDRAGLGVDRLGYVTAEVNGLRTLLCDFDGWRSVAGRDPTGRGYIDDLRDFGLALDGCIDRAFWTAVKALPADRGPNGSKTIALVPLTLGSDGLTAICDSPQAFTLAVAFLRAFEQETARVAEASPDQSKGPGAVLLEIARAATGSPGLTASAGVAIVKPHVPALRAYELSNALAVSAMTAVKRWVSDREGQAVGGESGDLRVQPSCSALDFHVHSDSAGTDLATIRDALTVNRSDETIPRTRIEPSAKPYVVTAFADIARALAPKEGPSGTEDDHTSLAWVRNRLWSSHATTAGLSELALTLNQPKGKENGDAKLPRAQQWHLRQGVFLGPQTADARLRQARQRYPMLPWRALTPANPGSLFFTEEERDDTGAVTATVTRTRLLDALELADIEGAKGDGL